MTSMSSKPLKAIASAVLETELYRIDATIHATCQEDVVNVFPRINSLCPRHLAAQPE